MAGRAWYEGTIIKSLFTLLRLSYLHDFCTDVELSAIYCNMKLRGLKNLSTNDGNRLFLLISALVDIKGSFVFILVQQNYQSVLPTKMTNVSISYDCG
jgi:hypothetical protein